MELNKFSKHQINCRECEECISGYPTLCRCGGLVHAEYTVKEEKGRFVNLGPHLRCDKCGLKFMKQNNIRRKGRGYNQHRNHQQNEHRGRTNTGI